MSKRILLTAAALLLSGCMTQYTHPDYEHGLYQKDRSECFQQATQESWRASGDHEGNWEQRGRPTVNVELQAKYCMVGRGWSTRKAFAFQDRATGGNVY